MAVNVNSPTQPKETSLDKVLKGLQIANSLFQIPMDIQKLGQISEARDTAKAEELRKSESYASANDPNSAESRAKQVATVSFLGQLAKSGSMSQEEQSNLANLIKGHDQQGPVEPGQTPLQRVPGLTAKALDNFNETNQSAKLALEKEKARAMVAAATVRGGAAEKRMDERQNQNAGTAGQAFEHDALITQTKKTINNITRAQSLLDGKEPITAKSFNILQQDFINATAGGAATEGKVNRELVETVQGRLNDIATHFGQVSDLRKEQPQIVENLRNMMAQVKSDFQSAQSEQAENVYGSFEFNSNPKVQETIKSKLKHYAPDRYAARFGAGTAGSKLDEGAPKGDGLPGMNSANASTESRRSSSDSVGGVPHDDILAEIAKRKAAKK